ncbi:MAG TPA: 2-oxo-4-hydroxy-4-carboxy-5-ureidoimidazoline decarboxylase [Streptosporangiaceae bacterium]|nr:2-oxo-4-hydroxy-4-carboxy-5-ureidoimidazoline decarboxylase [Streptosporangiaceae bacterium]
MPSVDEFNRLPEQAAREALGACCSSGRWIDAVLAGRPYPGIDALLAASDAAVEMFSQRDLGEALAGHPRIGDRRVTAGRPGRAGPAGPAAWSAREQAGVAGAGPDLRQALADGNAAYERRFGHIYLACATGRNAAELLDLLRQRLGNDAATEWRVAAAELAKINQIRLRQLVGPRAGETA